MFITKKSLPRRTVLRGLGVTLALPWMESMVPALTALAQSGAAPARRFGVFYAPNGMSMGYWSPTTEGPIDQLPPTLQTLQAHKDRVLMLGGLNQAAALAVVRAGAHSRNTRLGPSDQAKFEEYLDSVRDVERRIQMAETQNERELPVVDQPIGIPTDHAEHAELMTDLLLLGNTHFFDDLPIAVVAGKETGIDGGRYVLYPQGTPLANLHVSLLDKLGVRLDRFGDSTGPLANLGKHTLSGVEQHAKTHLSRLLERVEVGEEIVIARNGKSLAAPAVARTRPRPPLDTNIDEIVR